MVLGVRPSLEEIKLRPSFLSSFFRQYFLISIYHRTHLSHHLHLPAITSSKLPRLLHENEGNVGKEQTNLVHLLNVLS